MQTHNKRQERGRRVVGLLDSIYPIHASRPFLESPNAGLPRIAVANLLTSATPSPFLSPIFSPLPSYCIGPRICLYMPNIDALSHSRVFGRDQTSAIMSSQTLAQVMALGVRSRDDIYPASSYAIRDISSNPTPVSTPPQYAM